MRFTLLPLLLPCLFACTATRLATLQGNFNTLYEAKQRCEQSTGVPDERIPCEGEQDMALYELARGADAAASSAADPRTRIALLRLAGVAAWQGAGAAADALVNKVSFEGVMRCDALEERVRAHETWGAPRDCALLVLLPALLAHEVKLAQLAVLRKAGQCAVGDIALRDIVDTWADSTVLFVRAHESKALGYRGVSDSVRRYVAEAKRRMMCNFQKVRSFEPARCPAESARALEEKDRIESALGTTFLEECG